VDQSETDIIGRAAGVDSEITDQLQVRWNGVFNINKQIDGI
jgi:hypothetical protein